MVALRRKAASDGDFQTAPFGARFLFQYRHDYAICVAAGAELPEQLWLRCGVEPDVADGTGHERDELWV